MSNDYDNSRKERTPLELVIKTLTTHFVTVANYAFLCSLLRRPTRNYIFAVRVLFFFFVPALILVEVLTTIGRGLIQFLRNAVDEEDTQACFYISAALGMHAALHKSDSDPDAASEKLPLLQLSSNVVERKRTELDWAWAGKLAASVFALLQAVGTIVMYARRLESWDGDCFGLDHRNGAMGIASTICGTVSILILLMRLGWKVSHSYHAPATDSSLTSKSQLITQAILALVTHLLIACIFNENNHWLYTSAGVMRLAFIGPRYDDWSFWGVWQKIMLVNFVLIFRKEIGSRLGFNSTRSQRFLRHLSWKRARILFMLCVGIWIVFDVIRRLVLDIIQVVTTGDDAFWWQDPISDRIFVI